MEEQLLQLALFEYFVFPIFAAVCPLVMNLAGDTTGLSCFSDFMCVCVLTLRYCWFLGKEATNSKEMNIGHQQAIGIKIPKIYWKLTRHAVLTMEWIDGIKLTDNNRLSEANLNRKQLIDEVIAKIRSIRGLVSSN